jgi:hypothetical protein
MLSWSLDSVAGDSTARFGRLVPDDDKETSSPSARASARWRVFAERAEDDHRS